jgi:N-acetylmuramoyl-L-alanine amidase
MRLRRFVFYVHSLFFACVLSVSAESFSASPSLKITRPEAAESISLPVGFTFVLGTVTPSDSKVTCNGVECDVSEDGAFIGFAPIREATEWEKVRGKSCDAKFEFIAQHASNESRVVVPVVTPKSPSSSVVAQKLFDPPKQFRLKKDQWFALEQNRLGQLVYVLEGSVLNAKFGNGDNYRCEISPASGQPFEILVALNEVEVSKSPENASFQAYLFDPREDGRMEVTDLSKSSALPQVLDILSCWGFQAQAHSELSVNVKKAPRSLHAKGESTNSKLAILRNLNICLDPGHNPDRGAIGPRGFQERESTLLLAQETAKILEAEGANVELSRESKGLTLKKRHERFQELKPDLIVSIHNNSVGDGSDPRIKHGTQSFYLHPWSRPLAEAVQQSMLKHLGTTDMGCIRRNLYVTRFTECPSILIEPEFIIIPDQEKKFMNSEYRRKLAQAIVDGIKNFVLNAARGSTDKSL